MMKVKVDDASVISADGAPTAGLIDQHSLDSLKAAGDGLAYAALAPPAVSTLAASAVMRELRDPMAWTLTASEALAAE